MLPLEAELRGNRATLLRPLHLWCLRSLSQNRKPQIVSFRPSCMFTTAAVTSADVDSLSCNPEFQKSTLRRPKGACCSVWSSTPFFLCEQPQESCRFTSDLRVCRLHGHLLIIALHCCSFQFSQQPLRYCSQTLLHAQEVKVKYLPHLFLHLSICLNTNFFSISIVYFN